MNNIELASAESPTTNVAMLDQLMRGNNLDPRPTGFLADSFSGKLHELQSLPALTAEQADFVTQLASVSVYAIGESVFDPDGPKATLPYGYEQFTPTVDRMLQEAGMIIGQDIPQNLPVDAKLLKIVQLMSGTQHNANRPEVRAPLIDISINALNILKLLATHNNSLKPSQRLRMALDQLIERYNAFGSPLSYPNPNQVQSVPAPERSYFAPPTEVVDPKIKARNQWLEEKLNDPNRPLPKVKLVPGQRPLIVSADPDHPHEEGALRMGEFSVPDTVYDILGPDGQKVGGLVLKEPRNSNYFYISDIIITERGQGYGPATYLELLKSLPIGINLRTRGVVSTDAMELWDDMVAKGVAAPSTNPDAPHSYVTMLNSPR